MPKRALPAAAEDALPVPPPTAPSTYPAVRAAWFCVMFWMCSFSLAAGPWRTSSNVYVLVFKMATLTYHSI